MKEFFDSVPPLHDGGITLRRITREDASALAELAASPNVCRYLPTFLYEKKYTDIYRVIDGLYSECLEESLILGAFTDEGFCGLAEMYGYREPIHKISLGYRFLERCWGKGIATKVLGIMVDYLYTKTDVEIITASTMIENTASARVLMKNGFEMVVHAAGEDWGYGSPTIADKWIR